MREQREANEKLVHASLRAHEDVERAEDAKASAEGDRARLFEHAGWGIAIVKAGEHTLQAVNTAFACMHGFTIEEMIDMPLERVCATSSLEQQRREIRLAEESGHRRFEVTHVRKDGSEFPCLTDATTLRDADGRLTASAYNFQDMTEWNELKGRLAVADRLAALGTMTASIAHEINNPLACNVGNLACAMTELPKMIELAMRLVGADSPGLPLLQEQCTELLATLKDAQEGASRVQRVVADMNTFARSPGQSARASKLSVAIQEALRICNTRIPKCARVIQDFRSDPYVRHEAQLAQVFVNLLVNAVHAIESSGAAEPEIHVLLEEDQHGNAIVEVRDTGCGMSPETMARIFNPFFTTKPVGVGSGLGLSMSYSIVAAHGGEITVESVVGKGTAFRVRLPSTEPPAGQATAVEVTTPVRRLRALIVDDDAGVARALGRALGANHDVVILDSARAAQRTLEQDASFDIVICDLMMPEVTGMDLYEWAVVAHPQIAERMLFMTGGAFSERSEIFAQRMADRMLHKPFDRATVISSITKRLARC
ncbi:MAG: ATP-binding protein [Polyangia bacterium]